MKKYMMIVLGMFLFACSSVDSIDKVNLKKIEELEKQDVTKIQKEIDESDLYLQTQRELSSAKSAQKGIKDRFNNCLIVGDSLVEGISDYALLYNRNVIGIRGRRVDTCSQEINRVIASGSKKVFLCYGLNDILCFQKNVDMYIDYYRENIQRIQQALPNCEIYVNSMIPVSNWRQKERSIFKYYTKYNSSLKKMCEELNITYIDNTKLLDFSDDDYAFDGEHPVKKYYQLWIKHMADVAGL